MNCDSKEQIAIHSCGQNILVSHWLQNEEVDGFSEGKVAWGFQFQYK